MIMEYPYNWCSTLQCRRHRLRYRVMPQVGTPVETGLRGTPCPAVGAAMPQCPPPPRRCRGRWPERSGPPWAQSILAQPDAPDKMSKRLNTLSGQEIGCDPGGI